MPWKYTEGVLDLELGSSTGKKYLGKTSPGKHLCCSHQELARSEVKQ